MSLWVQCVGSLRRRIVCPWWEGLQNGVSFLPGASVTPRDSSVPAGLGRRVSVPSSTVLAQQGCLSREAGVDWTLGRFVPSVLEAGLWILWPGWVSRLSGQDVAEAVRRGDWRPLGLWEGLLRGAVRGNPGEPTCRRARARDVGGLPSWRRPGGERVLPGDSFPPGLLLS